MVTAHRPHPFSVPLPLELRPAPGSQDPLQLQTALSYSVYTGTWGLSATKLTWTSDIRDSSVPPAASSLCLQGEVHFTWSQVTAWPLGHPWPSTAVGGSYNSMCLLSALEDGAQSQASVPTGTGGACLGLQGTSAPRCGQSQLWSRAAAWGLGKEAPLRREEAHRLQDLHGPERLLGGV